MDLSRFGLGSGFSVGQPVALFASQSTGNSLVPLRFPKVSEIGAAMSYGAAPTLPFVALPLTTGIVGCIGPRPVGPQAFENLAVMRYVAASSRPSGALPPSVPTGIVGCIGPMPVGLQASVPRTLPEMHLAMKPQQQQQQQLGCPHLAQGLQPRCLQGRAGGRGRHPSDPCQVCRPHRLPGGRDRSDGVQAGPPPAPAGPGALHVHVGGRHPRP